MQRTLLIVFAILALLTALDAQRAPQQQAATAVALAAIDVWQGPGQHLLGNGGCLYTPTCSVYGELAVRRFGGYRGGWLAFKRIMRCAPWSDKMGEDWL